ncbi:GMC oxidoreductase [Amanita thiersii Skay4041]|uniref:GMC oxidoreductase n=1 Tax=Amanita thiersii Skay4041 TaxID=703135 RepID=A0A2A9NTD3_9AGAR|nr:GMC oxidoreductase [Amanita thiersii Skay4041]
MISLVFITVTLASLLTLSCHAYDLPLDDTHNGSQKSRFVRNMITESQLASSYDFVIAGGGLAGLVVASRLSENPSFSVLVLEAGASGDEIRSNINAPASTYYSSLTGSSYDWAYVTVPQQNVSNRQFGWPRGKVLGGSSAINAMYSIRPSIVEVDAWGALISKDDPDGAKIWDWEHLYRAMKKAENFSQPLPDVQQRAKITYNATSFGNKGPLHVSYPGFMPDIVGSWGPSLEAAGVDLTTDAYSGRTVGGFISALYINPNNWTRSYSKSAYIDPLSPRRNLDILTNAMVTRVLFGDSASSSGLTATGVEFATSKESSPRTVSVRKEVILAGGSLGSPHILQLSGVGPRDVLESAGVGVKVELPGVGQHLQDHITAGVYWSTFAETPGSINASGSPFSTTPEFMSFVNLAVAYVNVTTLLGPEDAAELHDRLAVSFPYDVNSLVPSQYSEVIEGYKAIRNVTADTILPSDVGEVELLLSLNVPGQIAIQAAFQHPHSHGRVYINSSSAFDPIIIDPQYFSHWADKYILREGIKLARRIGQTEPLSRLLTGEVAPGANITTDEQLEQWLTRVMYSQFHPMGTCAMLPRSQGGVVDAKLKVYGLANVRVVDASVFPFEFSAHLASPTFGLAEQGSSIIRSFYGDEAGSILSNNSAPGNTLLSSGSLTTIALLFIAAFVL